MEEGGGNKSGKVGVGVMSGMGGRGGSGFGGGGISGFFDRLLAYTHRTSFSPHLQQKPFSPTPPSPLQP